MSQGINETSHTIYGATSTKQRMDMRGGEKKGPNRKNIEQKETDK